jgi:hypothetical protein
LTSTLVDVGAGFAVVVVAFVTFAGVDAFDAVVALDAFVWSFVAGAFTESFALVFTSAWLVALVTT